MQASNLTSQECFDCEKLIQALKDDDTSQIEQQRKLIGPMLVYKHNATIPFEMALGEAILNSDLKFAEKMANFVVNTLKSASPYCKCKIYQGADDLPFWGQFIVFAMTDRDRVFDPWQSMNSAEAFIKMIRLGLGSDPTLRFTEKGESLTYYVVTNHTLSVQNKRHILRFMNHRGLLDLNPYNGHPSPVFAAISHRFTSIWNDMLCRYHQSYCVYDEHGNNVMHYVFKHKVKMRHVLASQNITTLVRVLCEKNKEGKAMIEYSIFEKNYPDWFFNRGCRQQHILAYPVLQELARNNETEVLQRLPPIPYQGSLIYPYLFTMYDFPHNKPHDRYVQSYTGTKRKFVGHFVGGSNSSTSTFPFEQLPIEIFEIILMELQPIDVMCLKMTSKVVAMAFKRTRCLSKFVCHSLGTTPVESPEKEFSRQVKIDVNWKKQRFRMETIAGFPDNPRSVMDEHWMFINNVYGDWLYNLHTNKKLPRKLYSFTSMMILLESGPVNVPIVAAFGDKFLVLMNFTFDGAITTHRAAHLDTTFKWVNAFTMEQPYIRQLMGKQIVLGRDGAIWNYEVDATVAHLLEPLSEESVCDVHANESVIVAATTHGLSLFDHRTFKRITNITKVVTKKSKQPLRVFLHNNEVVQIINSEIKYYDVRTHRLLDTVSFIEAPSDTVLKFVFDTNGTRFVVNNPNDSFNVVYNIRERGWESVLMTDTVRNEVFALNSYAMLMNGGSLALFS